MWKALSDSFERTGVSSQLRLRKILLTMRYAPTESMASHFLKFDKLVLELKSTCAKIEEIDIVCHLLLTMPEEYDMVVTALTEAIWLKGLLEDFDVNSAYSIVVYEDNQSVIIIHL